jgi:hypothetical protein
MSSGKWRRWAGTETCPSIYALSRLNGHAKRNSKDGCEPDSERYGILSNDPDERSKSSVVEARQKRPTPIITPAAMGTTASKTENLRN